MRLAIVACLLQSAFPKQADTLLLREDQCDDALFVAHWTHVPMCGALDFSKVDDVCGRLETRDVLLKLSLIHI